MQRELKFRAWHIDSKEMLQESYPGNVFIWASGGQPIEIMQYTGLKDKNGVEIYESDILEFRSGLVPKGTNPMIKQVVRWYKPEAEFINLAGDVIGNIYENPELINE